MTTQTVKPSALFPDLPRTNQLVDKNGDVMAGWQLFFQQNQAALQANLKNEGFLFPPLTASEIATIEGLYAPFIGQPYNTMLQTLPDISGQSIFDKTNRLPKVFIITFDAIAPNNVLTAAWKTYVLL